MTAPLPPCVILEDDDLLVVNKPAGVNTHSPSPHAGEGIYEWLRHREPRWAGLAIIHRLDKTTSGIMVFGKTTAANRSLTEQFSSHEVRKKYVLVTDGKVGFEVKVFRSKLVRVGERYENRPVQSDGELAETKFRLIRREAGLAWLEAEPLTGKTHQIRAHAAEGGFPILGDTLYGGMPAPRVHLHAREISFQHPASNKPVSFTAPENFSADARLEIRKAFVREDETDAYRLIHGASDGFPGFYVERLGGRLLSQSDHPLSEMERAELKSLINRLGAKSVFHKILNRQVRRTTVVEASPSLVMGEPLPEPFVIRENGVRFEMSFSEGYSTGLFLDQRENRRRLLTGHVAGEFPLFNEDAKGKTLLNTFAYTCGFSVCAAKSGIHTTSLDLSKKYLEWGRRNFLLNGIEAGEHDFIFGDVFDWMRRLGKKGRAFDIVILDPPTFSQSKETGRFSVEKDYERLVELALPLLKPAGVLLASSNAARLEPEEFVSRVVAAIQKSGRRVVQRHYVPQPLDFPVSKEEPAYLKTLWLRIS